MRNVRFGLIVLATVAVSAIGGRTASAASYQLCLALDGEVGQYSWTSCPGQGGPRLWTQRARRTGRSRPTVRRVVSCPQYAAVPRTGTDGDVLERRRLFQSEHRERGLQVLSKRRHLLQALAPQHENIHRRHGERARLPVNGVLAREINPDGQRVWLVCHSRPTTLILRVGGKDRQLGRKAAVVHFERRFTACAISSPWSFVGLSLFCGRPAVE